MLKCPMRARVRDARRRRGVSRENIPWERAALVGGVPNAAARCAASTQLSGELCRLSASVEFMAVCVRRPAWGKIESGPPDFEPADLDLNAALAGFGKFNSGLVVAALR